MFLRRENGGRMAGMAGLRANRKFVVVGRHRSLWDKDVESVGRCGDLQANRDTDG